MQQAINSEISEFNNILARLEIRAKSELAYLVGALADGSIYHSEKYYIYRVRYYENSKKYLELSIEPLINGLFRTKGHFYYDRRKNVYFYKITTKEVYKMMNKIINSFKDSDHRCVPWWILEGEQDVGRAFVRGFFDADEFYYLNPIKSDYRVRFGQVDSEVLDGVRRILAKDDFKCSEVLGPYRSKTNSKPYYELQIYGKSQMFRFHDLIRPSHPNKQLSL